jgi:hypothetical protein
VVVVGVVVVVFLPPDVDVVVVVVDVVVGLPVVVCGFPCDCTVVVVFGVPCVAGGFANAIDAAAVTPTVYIRMRIVRPPPS